MCGTYTTNEYTYNPGDFATCNGYIHSVDSAGNISQRPETTCPDAGQYEYTDGDYTYYTDGNCGTYSVFTGTCSSYGLSTGAFGTDSIFAEVYECFSIEVGTTSWEDFHDGTCGTYRSYQSPTYFYSYGSYLGNCNGYDYYSDGGSGYYY
jgi:hypothetical protein